MSCYEYANYRLLVIIYTNLTILGSEKYRKEKVNGLSVSGCLIYRQMLYQKEGRAIADPALLFSDSKRAYWTTVKLNWHWL